MSLREHFKEHFWSYTALGGLLGWAALKGESTKEENYNVEAYDMNLHVWLCGRCHDVFDEKEEADNCCLEVTEVTEDSLESEMFNADSWAKRFPNSIILYNTKGIPAKFRKDELDQRDWDGWVKLQSYGRTPAVRAEKITAGDVIIYNYGYKGKVLSIKPKGKASLLVETEDKSGKTYERTYRKTSLIPVKQSWQRFKAEMFIESDGLTVQLMGFDGSFLTDGEIKMGYTTASELGYEPKQLKPVMWVWDAQEDYGAYMATDQITFLTESFGSEDFASAIIAPEKVTGPMQQALMTNYLLRKSMLDDEMRYLQQEVRSGRMSKRQMAFKLLELENKLRAEEDPKAQHSVTYMKGVKVKPRKLNGDLPPEIAMKRTQIGRDTPEAIKVDWDSNTKPLRVDPFNEVEWGGESSKRGRLHKVGGQTVEECVDIQGRKVDATSNYYRVRFRDPKDFSNFRVPAWAARAANSIGVKYYDVRGSKITMGQTNQGEWKIQSIMIPNNSFVNPKEAAVIANHIQDRIEREGKWAKKECKDNERVLVVL